MTEIVRYGILGLGSMGNRMAEAIRAADNAVLQVVSSRDLARAEAFAHKHQVPTAVVGVDDLVNRDDIDAVYIATPNALHADQTCRALRARKHVLVEKPMALSVHDAREMVDVSRSSVRLLGIGFHLRYQGTHQRIRQILNDGILGDLAVIRGEWAYYQPNKESYTWQLDPEIAGAGSVMGLGVHLIDLLCNFADAPVVAVTAEADGPGDRWPMEFVTAGLLRFDGDIIASFFCGRRVAYTENSVTVYGTKGRLDSIGSMAMGPAGTLRITDERGSRDIPTITVNPFQAEIEAFSSAVTTGESFHASGEDGLRSVEVTEAIIRAARTSREADAAQFKSAAVVTPPSTRLGRRARKL